MAPASGPAASTRHKLPSVSLRCDLQLRFWLTAASPEGPLHGPGSALRSGWVAGTGVGGCLSALPSVPGLFWPAVAASLGDPDGHTSSVCRSPPTLPRLCQADPLPLPPAGLPRGGKCRGGGAWHAQEHRAACLLVPVPTSCWWTRPLVAPIAIDSTYLDPCLCSGGRIFSLRY